MKKTALQLVVIVLLLLVYSCQPEQEVAPDNKTKKKTTPTTLSEKGISGTELVNVSLNDGQSVSFWEVSPGVIGIRHSRSVDDEGKNNQRVDIISNKLDDLIQKKKSVLEIYNEISPSKVPKDLETLQSAYLRQQELEKQYSSKTPLPLVKPNNSELSNARVLACTPDYYNDSYGARWFLDRYCVEGGFRFCPTNVTWAYSGRSETSWFKTCAMAADFATGVRFRGWYWKQDCFLWSCNWTQVLNWDYTVLPRRVECWYFSGRGYRESQADGLATCPRVHFSAMWNN